MSLKKRCAATAETYNGPGFFQCQLREGHHGTHYWRGRPKDGQVKSCSWMGMRAVMRAREDQERAT